MNNEKYSFMHGSLYIWSEINNCYIHCFRKVGFNTKKKAIAEYEREQEFK